MSENEVLEQIRAGIDFCIEQGVDALVVAFGPSSTLFDPEDPLQQATKRAYDHDIPVVVAAGNFGPGKLQSLARAPWVISVGAVDGDDHLLPESGTGSADGEGPTVVSYGTPLDITDPDPAWGEPGQGTSFAAPRVAHVAAFVRVLLRMIIDDLSAQQSDQWTPLGEPARVPVIGVVDTGVDPGRLPPRPPLAEWDARHGDTQFQFGRTEGERRWYEALVGALRDAGAACTLTHGPAPVRRALELMARPLDGYGAREVGAGVVSIEEALEFLSFFTPRRFLDVFCPETMETLGASRIAEIDAALGPLWEADKVVAQRLHLADGTRLVVAKSI